VLDFLPIVERFAGVICGINSVVHFAPGLISTDEATRLMGEAFDAARASLDGQNQPELFYEIIAARIVEAARKGERDPIRLRDIGLEALGYKKDAV
jgi:hypothetical protein